MLNIGVRTNYQDALEKWSHVWSSKSRAAETVQFGVIHCGNTKQWQDAAFSASI